jgi:hypothetical protein
MPFVQEFARSFVELNVRKMLIVEITAQAT